MWCFDTDVLSAVVRRDPPFHLVRKLARLPIDVQFTTSITLGEMLYGVARRPNPRLQQKTREVVEGLVAILPFDEASAEIYGALRVKLESEGRRLAEPDLRIASIALSNDLTLVTGNVRHFSRVPNLRVENWLRG